MRITPQVIRVRDFRSFSEEQVISLADQPGTLGLITGVNEAEPDLGANGTGKSTVWDALCWCLFGKTIRGLRGPALLPWGVDVATPRVQFTFEVEGHRYTISRTANPNGIRLFREAEGPGADTAGLDGEEIDQASVERMVGLDYDLFLSTVVRGQFSESFLELTPRKKMEFLSKALDLDGWSEAAQRTSEERKEEKAKHTDALRELDRMDGALRVREAEVITATQAFDRAEAECASRRSERESHIQVVADALCKHKALRDQLAQDATDARISLERSDELIEKLMTEAEALQADSRDAGHRLAALEARAEMLSEAVSAAGGLEDTCPTCHSDLDAEARSAAQAAAESKLAAMEPELRQARLDAKTALAMYEDVVTRGKAARKSQKAKQAEERASENQLREMSATIETLEQNLEDILAPIVPEDHIRLRMITAGNAAEETKHKRDKAAAWCKEVEEGILKLDFWVKGFQDIRLWLLRAALDELEALSNSHTLSLGLRGWRILYEVERETKAGGIAKGFRCLIQSPSNQEPVPLETWSGGELQRLKIATQAAMCDLIRSRFGGAMALEVWDEPGQHLSTRGCRDMMAFFRERAATLGIEVWIVDHRSTTSGEFDQQLVVTRTRRGTSVKRGLR